MPLLSPDGDGRTAGHETMDGGKERLYCRISGTYRNGRTSSRCREPFRAVMQYIRRCDLASAGALGMVPPPTFCAEAYRSHLSLAVVIVAVGSSTSRNSQSNTLR